MLLELLRTYIELTCLI